MPTAPPPTLSPPLPNHAAIMNELLGLQSVARSRMAQARATSAHDRLNIPTHIDIATFGLIIALLAALIQIFALPPAQAEPAAPPPASPPPARRRTAARRPTRRALRDVTRRPTPHPRAGRAPRTHGTTPAVATPRGRTATPPSPARPRPTTPAPMRAGAAPLLTRHNQAPCAA